MGKKIILNMLPISGIKMCLDTKRQHLETTKVELSGFPQRTHPSKTASKKSGNN